jgi:hypothetical protein
MTPQPEQIWLVNAGLTGNDRSGLKARRKPLGFRPHGTPLLAIARGSGDCCVCTDQTELQAIEHATVRKTYK